MDKRILAVPVLVGGVLIVLMWRDRASDDSLAARHDARVESPERVLADDLLAATAVEAARSAADIEAAPTSPSRALSGTVTAYGAPVEGAHVDAVPTHGSSTPPLADDMRAFEERLASAHRTATDAQGAFTLGVGSEGAPWLVFAWKDELLPVELAPFVFAADATEAVDIELARFHAVEVVLRCESQSVSIAGKIRSRFGGFGMRVAANMFVREANEWADVVECVLGFDSESNVAWYRAKLDARAAMNLTIDGAPVGYTGESATHEIPDIRHGVVRIEVELRRESQFGAIEIVVDVPDFAERLRASEWAEFDLVADDRQQSLWIHGTWIEGDITSDGARSLLRLDGVPVGTYRLVLRADVIEVSSHVPPTIEVRAGEVATVRLDLPDTGAVRFVDVALALGSVQAGATEMYHLDDGRLRYLSVHEGRVVSLLPSGRYVFTVMGPDTGAWAFTPLGRTVPVPVDDGDDVSDFASKLDRAARAALFGSDEVPTEWAQLVDALAVDVTAGTTLELRPTKLRAPD